MHFRGILVFALFFSLSCKEEGKAKKGSADDAAIAANPVPPAVADAQAARAAVATPDIVSQASEPYAAGESVVTSESVDGLALRKRITKRLQSDHSPVTLLTGASSLALGQALCEAAVPRVPKSHPVLLKPNIGGFAGLRNPKRHDGDDGVQGRTTDPEFVRGVIRCLKARGHSKITVADSKSEDAEFWPKLMKASGYEAMAAEEGVALVAISDDGVFDVEGTKPGKPLAIRGMEKTSVPTLLMPKIVAEHLDHGLYISIPKIKTHRFSVVSMGIKGLQGTVMYSDRAPAYRQKWRSHRELASYTKALKSKEPEDRALYVQALETFAERMVDVLEVQAPHVILAEGTPAMSGDGFHKLIPHPELVAIGGTNAVHVDAVGARFLGLLDNEELAAELGGHTTSPLISLAAKRFGLDLREIRVVGNGAALLEKARPLHFIAMAPFVLRNDLLAPVEAPTAHASNAGSESMQIDGKPEEEVWKNAERVQWDTNYEGASTGIVTHARFAWNGSGLYAFFELEGAGLFVDQTRPNDVERADLYKEDCIEIFLTPDPTKPKHYYEIEVGPFGHWLDIEVDGYRSKGKFDISWSSDLRVATTFDPEAKRASIEIEMKGGDLLAVLKAGARLPMGLFRMEGAAPNRNYLAWSPALTPKPKFHIPEAFGLLVIEP